MQHGEHRVTHEVTLIKGAAFPVCKTCGEQVRFQLVRSAPLAEKGKFRVSLYELPHPEEDGGKQAA